MKNKLVKILGVLVFLNSALYTVSPILNKGIGDFYDIKKSLISGVLGIVVGVGLFLLRKWARLLFIVLIITDLIDDVILGLFDLDYHVNAISTMIPLFEQYAFCIVVFGMSIQAILSILIIIFLTRAKVKELFV